MGDAPKTYQTFAGTIRVKGDGVSTQYKVFLTSASDNCTELPAVKAGEAVTIPAQGVVTLVGVK